MEHGVLLAALSVTYDLSKKAAELSGVAGGLLPEPSLHRSQIFRDL